MDVALVKTWGRTAQLFGSLNHVGASCPTLVIPSHLLLKRRGYIPKVTQGLLNDNNVLYFESYLYLCLIFDNANYCVQKFADGLGCHPGRLDTLPGQKL